MTIAVRVSRFEANLLQITRSLVGAAPPRSCAAVLVCGSVRPEGLSSRCIRLLEQMLSRGVISRLLRLGGWRIRRWLHDGEAVECRAWRTAPAEQLAFRFSEQSLEFLLWLTTTPFGVEREWKAKAPLTIGDRVLLFLAYDALQEYPAVQRYNATFGQSELCRLAWPEHFPLDDKLDFSEWFSGVAAVALAMLEDKLVDVWRQSAEHRAGMSDTALSQSYGRLQRHVLKRYISHCHRNRRVDLARPLLRIANGLTRRRPELDDWCGVLDLTGLSVSERSEARRESLSLLDSLDAFSEWTRWARSIGFVDEEYAVAQFWLGEWEQFNGERSLSRTSELRRRASPLAIGRSNPPQSESLEEEQ